MSEQQEKKNKRTATLISIIVHSVLLLAFLFVIAWREPDPPLPEYGIELNFGLDNVGTGDIQPTVQPEDSDSEEEAAPEELPEESTETTEVVEESTASEVEAAEESTQRVQESPDVVETKEVKQEKPTPVEEKPEEKEEKKAEVKKTETKSESGAQGETGEADSPQQANQGDNIDKTGDKGNEQGTLDSRALYGNPGGGGGSSLQLTGWTWDFRPKPNDTSDENGRIVFEIKIDDQGEILSVRTLERSVSPAVEKIYRAEVEKLTFSKTSDNSIAAPVSTGRITFVIKSK